MADWTNIPNTSLDPDAPARSIDAKALRDNPIAIVEGAPGAPRITGVQGAVVSRGGIVNNAVNLAKIQTLTASTSVTVFSSSPINITLNRGAFFPMIRVPGVSAQDFIVMTGHSSTGAATAPRFGFRSTSSTGLTVTVAHEYIIP